MGSGTYSQKPHTSRFCNSQKNWQCSVNLCEEDGMKSQCLPRSTPAPKDSLLAGKESNLLFLNLCLPVWAKVPLYEIEAVILGNTIF